MYLDVTGLDASPALIPALLDLKGDILYRASVLGKETGADRGHASYIGVDDYLDLTRLYEYVADSFMIKPEETYVRNDSDFVISWKDSLAFQEIINNMPEGCPVLIIMGD